MRNPVEIVNVQIINVQDCRVLVLEPTGVAAINVNGNTIHSGLGIHVGNFRKRIPKLDDKKRSTLRHQLSEVKVIQLMKVKWSQTICYFTYIRG